MQHLVRQMSVVSPERLKEPITIIGAGAVGGWSSFLLAKIGYGNQEIYDFDAVSIENVGPQFFTFSQVGMPKVVALAKSLLSWTKCRIRTNNRPWNNDALQTKIVVSAADSMKIRKELFLKCKGRDHLFIDARMGSEMIMLYAVDCNDLEACNNYAMTLYSDEEAAAESCTDKATAYTAALIGGLITKIIKDYTHKKPFTRIVRWDLSTNDYQAKVV